jgi:hypothetical protein
MKSYSMKLIFSSLKISKKDFFLLLIFYGLSHFAILFLLDAIYWDDWLLYGERPLHIFERFRQQGSMFNYVSYLYVILLKIGPWAFKVFALALMFVSGLSFRYVLSRYKAIDDDTLFVVTLLFMVLPFYLAREFLINIQYTLCYCLFFVAWAMIDRYKYLSAFLFFVSFNTNSLLVFFLLPMLDLLYRNRKGSGIRTLIHFIFTNKILLILPLVFFYIKTRFFPPYGLYAGYNQFHNLDLALQNISSMAAMQVANLFAFRVNPLLFALFFLISLFLISKKGVIALNARLAKNFIFVGFFSITLGAFPYWVMGHPPIFNIIDSRHQLLLPLGFSLLFTGLLMYFGLRARKLLLSSIIGLSLAFNVSGYFSLYVDWQKQSNLINLFRENEDIKKASLIVFIDNTISNNVSNREYRFYDWNGLMATAFGNESHFGINPFQVKEYETGKLNKYFTALYRAGNYSHDAQITPLFIRIDFDTRPTSDSYLQTNNFFKLPSQKYVLTPIKEVN